MSDPKSQSSAPYTALGTHLKYLREQHKESLAEVSGAVEIEIENLERMERGMERPSEEILMLLINHFDIQDNEAVQLWELAGYDSQTNQNDPFAQFHDKNGKLPMIMLLAVDMRTLYTDGCEISASKNGIVMNFHQSTGQSQPTPVARIGMSLEQAKQTLAELQQAIIRTEYSGPKRLPGPKEQN